MSQVSPPNADPEAVHQSQDTGVLEEIVDDATARMRSNDNKPNKGMDSQFQQPIVYYLRGSLKQFFKTGSFFANGPG